MVTFLYARASFLETDIDNGIRDGVPRCCNTSHCIHNIHFLTSFAGTFIFFTDNNEAALPVYT
jgi:hypothetical protein